MRGFTYLGIFCFWFVLQLQWTACSSTRLVKPLEAGQTALGFDLGGPLIDFAGLTIPIPISSLSGAYGLKEGWTVFGALHTTSAAFGNLQLEAGVLAQILAAKNRLPGLSAGLSTQFITRFAAQTTRIYPQIDLNLYWPYSQKYPHFAYLALNNWFDLYPNLSHGLENTHRYLPALGLGHTFLQGKMRYNLEVKWIAPQISNRDLIVSYNGLGGQGSLGLFFSVSRLF